MINQSDYRLFLFDLDDTLIGTRYAYRQAQVTALQSVFTNIPTNQLDQYVSQVRWLCDKIGSSQSSLYFTAFLEEIDDTRETKADLLSELLTVYDISYWELLAVLPGALDYLERLSVDNKKMALVSNGKVETQNRKLERCDLADYFSLSNRFISGDYDPSLKKPSPHMVEEACRTNGVTPNETIFFGNATIDILAGNLAGVTTVLIGEHPSDAFAPKISIPDLKIARWDNI